MDFSRLDFGYGHPSDIDMFFINRHNMLILGEIKNEKGKFKDYQRRFYEKIINNYIPGGTCLYITHKEYVEQGSRKVDISNCYVKEYLWNGKWVEPRKPTKVKEAMEILDK